MPYGYYVADAAKDHVSNLLSMGTTAILCCNDLMASGVIAECRKRGFRVPEDVSVIGFDDLPISASLDSGGRFRLGDRGCTCVYRRKGTLWSYWANADFILCIL